MSGSTPSGDDVAVDIDDIAERLYSLPPEEFTAARDAAAKATEGAGRKAVQALRRPTVPAYVVNCLVRAHGEQIDSLLALGADLRGAMTGRGGDLRALTESRREIVSRLVRAAADAAGRELTAAVEEDVAATLEAATADPDLGAAVRSGRLVKPLRYAGFGAMPDLDDVLATPIRRPAKRPATNETGRRQPAGQQPAKKAATKAGGKQPAEPVRERPDLTALRQRVLELSGAADDAQRRYETAARAVAEARTRLAQAEQERSEAHRAANAAQREAEKARRELGKLERA